MQSALIKDAMRKRVGIVERYLAHVPDRRGMRRTSLLGRENIHPSDATRRYPSPFDEACGQIASSFFKFSWRSAI